MTRWMRDPKPATTNARSSAALAVFLLVSTSALAGAAAPASAPVPVVGWTVERPGDGASPRGVVPLDGTDVAVVFDTRLERYDADGAVTWSRTELPLFGNTIAARDVTNDGHDDVLVASAAISNPPAALSALDGTDGTTLWSVATGGAQVNAISGAGAGPAAVVTIAAMPSLGTGRVEAYAADGGTQLWSQEVGEVVTALTTSLSVTAAGTQDGRVVLFDTTTGTRLADVVLPNGGLVRDLVPTGSPVGVTLVAVADRGVYGLTGAAIEGIVQAPLRVAWTYGAGARFWSGTADTSDLAVGDSTVYVNARTGPKVHALDSQSGAALWTAGDNAPRSSLPYLSPDSIVMNDVTGDGAPEAIAAGSGNRTTAFDAATGQILWAAPTPGPVDALAALDDGRTVMTQPYWFVGGLDATGSLEWSHDYGRYQAGVAHDLDADGTSDLVTATPGHLYVIDGATGAERLGVAMWPYLGDAVTTNVAVAELNGDDSPDLVASARTGSIRGVVAAFDGATGDLLWRSYADYIIGGTTGRLIVHDLDGDGTPDITFGSNKGYPSHVIALSGKDGQTLWRHHVGDDVLDLDLARTPEGDRIVFLRGYSSCGCHVHPGLVALDGDGAVAWSRDVTDNGAHDIAIARDPLTGADRVVVRDADDPPEEDVPLADGDGPRFAYIDPATGEELRRVLLGPLTASGLDAGPFFVTGDVDGDAHDDIVLTLREARGRDASAQVVVLSGANNEVLWTSEMRTGTANTLAVAPTPGGAADVLAAWSGGTIARLSGADGAARWAHPAEGLPVWFLAPGNDAVFAPQGTLVQALLEP